MSIQNQKWSIVPMVAAFAMIVSLIAPVVTSAAQVTDRSVQLSNSSASATNVSYTVNFTSVSAAGAFVVDFCSNSPLVGQSCTAPTGMDAASATSATSGFSDVTGSTNKVVVAGTVAASTPISVQIDGIDNPTTSGAIYARVITYDTKLNATAYTSTDLGSGNLDNGGAAISITPTIGVSGVVLETMSFCVSGSAISANCTDTTAPVLELGETAGGVKALTAGVISTGKIYTQISTNAVSGAVIRLKSNATDCGGLLRAGAPSACDILPALNADIDENANEAKFGVKTATATDTPSVNSTGAFAPVSGSVYNNSTYGLNYVSGNATGITSTFGDPFLDTAAAPASNKNMELTFGATIANNTPAGSYSANLSLIATGKF